MAMDTVAIVTGAGSGIGREAALAFTRAGVRVVVADIAIAAGEETAQQIAASGGDAIFVRTDVTRADSVENLVKTAVSHFGQLDYAFNNAGVAQRDFVPIAELSEEEWDRVVGINLKGVWLCMKYECQALLARGGAIVNTSSIMGRTSRPNISAYSAAKAGVIGLTKSAALDYARQGIRINAVCPGGIATPMTADPAMATRLAEATPMGRLGEAREIADAVVWLCSPQASFITGQALAVDGGYTLF
jgi:NAD(P)-dependent dehydrogenase (short-subunit alcohol dehydrogenase family)